MTGELQGSDFSEFLGLLMLFAKEGSNGDLGVSVHGALACRHVIEEDNPPEQREFPLPSVKACQSMSKPGTANKVKLFVWAQFKTHVSDIF